MHKAGFKMLLANELSPMAAESFSCNFFGEYFDKLAEDGKLPEKAVWLSSQYPELKRRLRENPFQYPAYDSAENQSQFPEDAMSLHGKLVVGSIIELNKLVEASEDHKNVLSSGFGSNGVDLVSGGPPCQSFSMAGMRKKDCDKNTLPWEFAKFVSNVKPKVALLENVTGILRAFKDEDGNKFHAWFEVAKVFASIGYVPLCLHVNARMAGVAQNRPRFIMIAVRHDVCEVLMRSFKKNGTDYEMWQTSLRFYQLVDKNKNNLDAVEFGELPYYDAEKRDCERFETSEILDNLVAVNYSRAVSVKDALDDLKQNSPSKPSEFVNRLNSCFSGYTKSTSGELANHEFRLNSHAVKCRFRIYQVLQQLSNRAINADVLSVMKGETETLTDTAWSAMASYEFLDAKEEKLMSFRNKSDFETYLKDFRTKKQTQKALDPTAPAPAALSIPDDACHYDERELRVLTVREMARIQSFPDNFEFRSKVTTGGQMRKFEVPQYTQVGNAVPPLLGLALGESIKKLLDRYNSLIKLEERHIQEQQVQYESQQVIA
ncbi:DNA (cytosine-5-)-methyltransferase [Ferrimonas balearica]|nr:DNA (cytosine-5-)-methyltransferase [Ferrimonas balearica]